MCKYAWLKHLNMTIFPGMKVKFEEHLNLNDYTTKFNLFVWTQLYLFFKKYNWLII